MKRRVRGGPLWIPVACLLVACGRGGTPLRDVLPDAGAVPAWRPVSAVQDFDAVNLYDLVDGQADAFFAYAFEQVAVCTYEDAGGRTLRIEVWQLETPSDAFGLFTTYRAGSPVSIGNGGDTDPGRRLDFWQDRYFVRVSAIPPLEDSVLDTFARQVSSALPTDGRAPSLISRLPQRGLVEGSEIFFHREISIQDYLWLGGQNFLALGPETDAVLARYEVKGGMVWLLLVQYPSSSDASAALGALQSGRISNVAAARVHEDLLGAVFGLATETEIESFFDESFEQRREGA